MTRKLNITLPGEDFRVIEEIASKRGMSVSAFVRETLRVGIWFEQDVILRGNHVFTGTSENNLVEQYLIPSGSH